MRHLRLKSAQQHGFSLIEVLIALVLLGVGLLGLARLQLSMLSGTAESVLHDSAVRLAEDKLEALRFELAAGQTPLAGSDETQVDEVTLRRTWTWSVDANGLAETTITAKWRNPKTSDELALSIPAKLTTSAMAGQAWLIQSGPPSRETLP
jgi:type IV pilus assembly protein PilV